MIQIDDRKGPCGSPWGQPQNRERYARGIWWVSTASHGGFYVSAERRAQMPAPLRTIGEGSWFEEDCGAWAAVAVAFPELFKPEDVEAAWKTLRNWEPEEFAELTCSEVLVPEFLQKVRAWAAERAVYPGGATAPSGQRH